jgi:predicted nucleotide-binding protein
MRSCRLICRKCGRAEGQHEFEPRMVSRVSALECRSKLAERISATASQHVINFATDLRVTGKSMARRSSPEPKRLAQLTPEEMRRGVERIVKLVERVRQFDPRSVAEQYNIPQLDQLSAAIEEGLARTFGPDTLDFERYQRAKDFDNGPHNYAYEVPITEVHRSLERSKQSNVALLEQAIEALNERLAEARGKGEEWISAAAAIEFLRTAMGEGTAKMSIAARANDGMLRARAARLIQDSQVRVDAEVPSEFWWARGYSALTQNWTTGDFETWIDHRKHWRAYGVQFLNSEIENMISAMTKNRGLAPTSRSLLRKVFVVHGRDEAVRESVARFLEKIGFEAVILHEKANQGRTVIEKVEAHSDVGFAVVLLTPDDEGCVKGGTPQPRARQNVLLELGYLIGRLTRERVCTLKVGELEIPSDWRGVIDEPFDLGGGWKQTLGRELEAAGYQIDWNKVMK